MSENATIGFCNMSREMFLGEMYKTEPMYVDSMVLQCFVSPLSKKGNVGQFHIGIKTDEGAILRFVDLNSKMRKEETVENYLESLNQSLTKVITDNVSWTNGDAVNVSFRYGQLEERSEGESLSTANLRIVIVIKDFVAISREEENSIRKKMLGEVNNWAEEVIHDVPYEAPKEDYSNDITVRMGVDMIPHEKQENTIDSTMAIFAVLFAILGIFLHEWWIFQIAAVVVGGCFAFRAYQHERYIVLAICAVAALVGLCIAFYEYRLFQIQVEEAQANKAMIIYCAKHLFRLK